MADTIERLYKITVDATTALRALQAIAANTAAVDKKLQAFGDTIKKAAAQLAIGFAAKEFVAGILRTSEAFDQLGKDAQKVGVAVEDLQKLRYAADLAGVSSEQMDKAVASLAVGMADLATGTSDTAKALRAIGVTSGDSPTAALAKIADHFAAMPDGVQKTSEAIALFGKKIGPDLIPLLNGGAKELKKLADEADRFGGIISAAVIAQAEKFNDNLGRLQKASASAGAQLTIGMMPAMSGVTSALVELVSKSDAFQTFGQGIGDILVLAAKGAARLTQGLVIVGKTIAALAAASENRSLVDIIFGRHEIGTVWDAWKQDVAESNAATNKFLDDLDKGMADARAAMAKPTPIVDPMERLKAELAAQKARADAEAKEAKARADAEAAVAAVRERRRKADADAKAAADELRKAYESLRNETADSVNVQNIYNDAMRVSNAQFEKAITATTSVGKARNEATKAIQDQLDAQDQANALMQQYILLAQTGTEEQKKLAGEWLASSIAIKKVAPVLDDTAEEMKAMQRGFDGFVDALSSGTVSISQAFEGMAKSIIASLLKILAQKYIVDTVTKLLGPKTAAQGAVFEAGEVVPFARGGVISRPLMLPMALMGEAGPEAVMPLKRGADGNLGVAGGAAGDIHVTVNNNAPGVEVATRRTGPTDLEILVQRTKDAIAADVQRGGNSVARSFESTYGLGRGVAAPF